MIGGAADPFHHASMMTPKTNKGKLHILPIWGAFVLRDDDDNDDDDRAHDDDAGDPDEDDRGAADGDDDDDDGGDGHGDGVLANL